MGNFSKFLNIVPVVFYKILGYFLAIFRKNLLKYDFRAMQRNALCRSRREISNAYFLAKFRFDTAENEPCKVCPSLPILSRRRAPLRSASRTTRTCRAAGPSRTGPTASASAGSRRCLKSLSRGRLAAGIHPAKFWMVHDCSFSAASKQFFCN